MPTWQRKIDGKHPAMGCFFHPWVDGSIRGGAFSLLSEHTNLYKIVAIC